MQPIKRVVFTGKLSRSRNNMENEAASLGIFVEDRVSRSTTHVVTGKRPGKIKMGDAEKFGVPVIDEAAFRLAIANAVPAQQPAREVSSPAKAGVDAAQRKVELAPEWIEALRNRGEGVGF